MMKIVKLFPRKGTVFHFGNNSMENSDIIFRADSLISAICCNHAEFNPNIEEFINSLPNISSVFPAVNTMEGNEVFFIPKPRNLRFSSETISEKRKIIKKSRYVSVKLYSLYLEKGELDVDDFIDIHGFLCHKDENLSSKMNLFSNVTNQRVSKSRDFSEDNSLYSINGFRLNQGFNKKLNKKWYSFFYFLIDGEINDELRKALEQIKINGLGGDRSVGYGVIEDYEISDFNVLNTSKEGKQMSLSPFTCPEEEMDKIESYSLIKRSGFIDSSPFKRKTVIAFDVGSVVDGNVKGQVLKVQPSSYDKKIYRVLKPFFIGCRG